MTALTELPNVGKILAEKLKRAGIQTVDDLKATGCEQVFLQIRVFDDTACFNMLCALEGAIRGIHWHDLPAERKQELKQFLKMKNIPISPLIKAK